MLLIFCNGKKINDVKMIIPSNIVNHITIAESIKIITIKYLFSVIQPYYKLKLYSIVYWVTFVKTASSMKS